jgi:hypothetical protein
MIVFRTLHLRTERYVESTALLESARDEIKNMATEGVIEEEPVTTTAAAPVTTPHFSATTSESADKSAKTPALPPAGSTLKQVLIAPSSAAPAHTWCRCDHAAFNVRVGPDYNRYKRKGPSGAPIYEPFAVDIFW